MFQEEWENEINKLFSALPVLLDDDEEEERKRDAGLCEIRGNLAQRFMEVSYYEQDDADDRMSLKDAFEKHVEKLKGIHGPDMVFAPFPSKTTPEHPSPTIERSTSSSSLVSGVSGSSSSKPDVIPHQFFYLCRQGSVWTVLQARA